MPIYAAFDADDHCLYVGEASREHPALRWAEHVRNKEAAWTDDAVRWEVVRGITERSVHDRLKPIHSHRSAAKSVVAPPAEGSLASVRDLVTKQVLERLAVFMWNLAINDNWPTAEHHRVQVALYDFGQCDPDVEIVRFESPLDPDTVVDEAPISLDDPADLWGDEPISLD
jgi:hypothetical protein